MNIVASLQAALRLVNNARAHERAAVVTFLRERQPETTRYLRECIERGDHLDKL
jgi:hypothetical protein